MLVLTRKTGEEIVIDGHIRVTISAIQGDRVRVGVTAPPDVRVDRAEVARRIAEFAPKAAGRPCELAAAGRGPAITAGREEVLVGWGVRRLSPDRGRDQRPGPPVLPARLRCLRTARSGRRTGSPASRRRGSGRASTAVLTPEPIEIRTAVPLGSVSAAAGEAESGPAGHRPRPAPTPGRAARGRRSTPRRRYTRRGRRRLSCPSELPASSNGGMTRPRPMPEPPTGPVADFRCEKRPATPQRIPAFVGGAVEAWQATGDGERAARTSQPGQEEDPDRTPARGASRGGEDRLPFLARAS
jgi:carbon storage regulator